MKVTYIKLFNNKNKDEVLMKHLREDEKMEGSNLIDSIKHKSKDYINRLENSKRANIKKVEKNVPKKVKDKNLIDEVYKKEDSKTNKMKNPFKKNQVALIAVALMLVTAGYLNYTNNLKIETAELGDARLVSTNTADEGVTEQIAEVENNDSKGTIEESVIENNIEVAESKENISSESELETAIVENNERDYENNSEKVIETAASNEYFTQTKLERDTMYSQMIETYQKILENNSIANDQKNIAAEEIKNINNRKSSIATIENLIKTKGMSDVVVLINDNSINAVIKSKENLTDEQVAQVTNIVSRELNADIENIHITTHI